MREKKNASATCYERGGGPEFNRDDEQKIGGGLTGKITPLALYSRFAGGPVTDMRT